MNRWLTFLMAACLVLAGCVSSLPRHGPIDNGLAAFIPSDAVALVDLRVDRLRSSPIYRKLAAQNRLPGFEGVHADDVNELLLASDGKNALVIARGVFPAKMDGVTLVDNRTALAGPAVMVQAALERHKRAAHEAPRDLIARVEALPADTQIWAVVAGWRGLDPETLREMGNAANLDRILRSVEGANLTIDMRTGVRAAFVGDCRTEADGAALANSLRGLASFARAGLTHNQPDVLRAFDGLQVRQEGRVVKLNIDIPQDLADKLLDKARPSPR